MQFSSWKWGGEPAAWEQPAPCAPPAAGPHTLAAKTLLRRAERQNIFSLASDIPSAFAQEEEERQDESLWAACPQILAERQHVSKDARKKQDWAGNSTKE